MTHTTGAAPELAGVAWRKSVRSNADGNCVEVGPLPGAAGVAVRHSRSPEGPVLIYTRAEMTAFILGVRDGEFDDLVFDRPVNCCVSTAGSTSATVCAENT